jgi:hypothetical protein
MHNLFRQLQKDARRIVLYFAPLFAFALLSVHPSGNNSSQEISNRYFFILPVVEQYILVHVIFALVIGLLGYTLLIITEDLHGFAAHVSRLATRLFIVFYIAYESIVGTAYGTLVYSARILPPEEQTVIMNVLDTMISHPLSGDFPAFIPLVGCVAWVVAVISVAIALEQKQTPLLARILLGMSAIGFIHIPPTGPIAMLMLLFAIIWMELSTHSKSPIENRAYRRIFVFITTS